MKLFARLSLLATLWLNLAGFALAQSAPETLDRFDAATAPVLIGAVSDKLKEFGFYQGPHVASVTPPLGKAIAAYRVQSGLPAGSFADQELVNRLNFGPPVKPSAPKIATTATDAAPIRQAQVRLQTLGYYTAKIDGQDGPATQEAIRQFQGQHDMAIDGKATPELIEKLRTAE
jgi:hypothetical protein